MVSTRQKVYESPPDISQSPKTRVMRKVGVKKLIKKLPSVELLNLACAQHQKEDCDVFFPTKKKHDMENNSGEMLFVIDKRPSRTSNSTNPTSGIIDSDEEVNKCDGGNDVSPKMSKDDNFKSELVNVSTSSQNGEPPEEIFEIDMSNIKTANDDSLKLRLEDTDEDSSNDSMDLDNENDDHFNNEFDKNIHELPMASQTRNANNSTNNLENCDEETEQFDSQFFVIDKGPSSSKSVIEDSQLYIMDRGTSEKTVEMQGHDELSSEESESEDEPTPASIGYNLASRIHTAINLSNSSYVNLKPLSKKPLPNTTITSMKNKQVEQLMHKSILKPGFEKQHFVEPITSKRQQKRDRRAERAKTKGAKWYDMAAPEMTSELKNDLSVLQMRRALDPKRFYKNNDMPGLPKYFQMGRVVESAADFYHGRVPKKQRKANIVEELLADAEFRKINKKKYTEIQEKKIQRSRGAYKHMKRLKKKK